MCQKSTQCSGGEGDTNWSVKLVCKKWFVKGGWQEWSVNMVGKKMFSNKWSAKIGQQKVVCKNWLEENDQQKMVSKNWSAKTGQQKQQKGVGKSWLAKMLGKKWSTKNGWQMWLATSTSTAFISTLLNILVQPPSLGIKVSRKWKHGGSTFWGERVGVHGRW